MAYPSKLESRDTWPTKSCLFTNRGTKMTSISKEKVWAVKKSFTVVGFWPHAPAASTETENGAGWALRLLCLSGGPHRLAEQATVRIRWPRAASFVTLTRCDARHEHDDAVGLAWPAVQTCLSWPWTDQDWPACFSILTVDRSRLTYWVIFFKKILASWPGLRAWQIVWHSVQQNWTGPIILGC
jgi:hypothetical protein